MKTLTQAIHLELQRLFPRDTLDGSVPERIYKLLTNIQSNRDAESIKSHLNAFGINLPKEHFTSEKLVVTKLSNKQLADILDRFNFSKVGTLTFIEIEELISIAEVDKNAVFLYVDDYEDDEEYDDEDEEECDDEDLGIDPDHSPLHVRYMSESDTQTYDFRSYAEIPPRLRDQLQGPARALSQVRVRVAEDVDYSDPTNIREICAVLREFKSDYKKRVERYKKYAALDSEFNAISKVQGIDL